MSHWTPIMNDLDFAQLVGNLSIGTIKTKLAEDQLSLHLSDDMRDSVFLRAGVDKFEMMGRDCYPLFFLTATPALRQAVKECCIYELHHNNFYTEVCGNDGLYLRYQSICGSRLLGFLSAGQKSAICIVLAGLLMEKQTQAGVAVKAPTPTPTTEAEEMALLTASDDKLLLPKVQLKFYAGIKAKVMKAGGRYNSRGYFVFPVGINPADVLSQLLDGKVVNGKKDSQSFFTPQVLAEQVVGAFGSLAGKRVLEPSGGHGALADLARDQGADVTVIENFPANVFALTQKGYAVLDRDFLSVTPDEIGLFDAIVANPPFTKGQDMQHIEHMFQFLKPGGTLSVIASTSWVQGTQKRQLEFKSFLENQRAIVSSIEAGAFKESGTTVATVHITLRKAQAVTTTGQLDLLLAA